MAAKDNKTYTSTEKINKLPDVAKTSTYFTNNKSNQLTSSNFYNDLNTQKINQSTQNKNTTASYNSPTTANLVPAKANINPNIKTANLVSAKANINSNAAPAQLVPSKSLNTDNIQPFKIDQKPNILTGNVSKENLLKTESISKTNFNILEISQKNKEIMNLDQKMKQAQQRAGIEKPQATTVINNYSGQQGGMRAPISRGDPLAGIKNTMRSLPSWRVDMG